MKILSIAKEISFGYNNVFLGLKSNIVEMPFCPGGFERALLGKNLQIPVCISKVKYASDELMADIDTGKSPMQYYGKVTEVDGVMQRQKDGRVILVWYKDF